MTVVTMRPRSSGQTVLAWRFTGQGVDDWPAWVRACCSPRRGRNGLYEVLHLRRSGLQVLNQGEWLVKNLDGGVCYYTDRELRNSFEESRGGDPV